MARTRENFTPPATAQWTSVPSSVPLPSSPDVPNADTRPQHQPDASVASAQVCPAAVETRVYGPTVPTVIVAVALLPSLVALMVALPARIPYARAVHPTPS